MKAGTSLPLLKASLTFDLKRPSHARRLSPNSLNHRIADDVAATPELRTKPSRRKTRPKSLPPWAQMRNDPCRRYRHWRWQRPTSAHSPIAPMPSQPSADTVPWRPPWRWERQCQGQPAPEPSARKLSLPRSTRPRQSPPKNRPDKGQQIAHHHHAVNAEP